MLSDVAKFEVLVVVCSWVRALDCLALTCNFLPLHNKRIVIRNKWQNEARNRKVVESKKKNLDYKGEEKSLSVTAGEMAKAPVTNMLNNQYLTCSS